MIDQIGRIHRAEKHIHSAAKVYPTEANGTQIAGAAGAWGLSAGFTEIIPINTIASDFDIHFINVEAASAADVFEIVLYAVETEIARVRVAFIDVANSQTLPSIPVQTDIIKKNTQIQAKIATKGGGADTIDLSLAYHTY